MVCDIEGSTSASLIWTTRSSYDHNAFLKTANRILSYYRIRAVMFKWP